MSERQVPLGELLERVQKLYDKWGLDTEEMTVKVDPNSTAVEQLQVLHDRLENDGHYVDANTVWLLMQALKRVKCKPLPHDVSARAAISHAGNALIIDDIDHK